VHSNDNKELERIMLLSVVRQVVPAGLLDVCAQYSGNKSDTVTSVSSRLQGIAILCGLLLVILDGPTHSAAFGNLVESSYSLVDELSGCHITFKI